MPTRSKALQFIAVLLFLIGIVSSPESTKAVADSKKDPRYSTPQLIKMALKKGEIDSDTANLYLAYALQDNTKIPIKYRGEIPYDGTLLILELKKSLRNSRMRASVVNQVSNIIDSFCDTEDLTVPPGPLTKSISTEHFYIEYEEINGGLNIDDYVNTLETAWNIEINTFGWAAPPVLTENPPPNNLYHVRILDLPPDVFGLVNNIGTHAGFVGDNPNTVWDNKDASATCMVLNNNYIETGSDPLIAAQVTAAHEFNHSVQYGYTDLNDFNSFGIVPNFAFIEGGAAWMEDEVFDNANDNYLYLWPNFDDSLGFPAQDYPHWIALRAMTERYGSGLPNGSEQVMQDFWENISQGSTSDIEALDAALMNRGTNLSDAFQAYAIAVKYNKPCSGNYSHPYCLEEGPAYVAQAGNTEVHGTIHNVGQSASGTLIGGYTIAWVELPLNAQYTVNLRNSSSNGEFKASLVCDTGSGFVINELPNVVFAGQTSSFGSLDAHDCNSVVAVVVNQEMSQVSSGFKIETLASPLDSIGILINQGSDDGGTNPGDCAFYNTDNEVYLGACFNGDPITSGFRFNNIQIPRHANIESSYIRFTVDGEYTVGIKLQIDAEASSNPLTFSASSPPSNRLTTGNPITWLIQGDTWGLGDRRNTPDLSNLIQIIVNRPDWNSGQSISIIIKNAGSTDVRRVIGYERASFDPSLSPAQLVVTYNLNPTPAPTATLINSTPLPVFTPTSILPTYTHVAPPTSVPTNPPAQVPWICRVCGIGCPASALRLTTNGTGIFGTPTPYATTPTPASSSLRIAETIDLTTLLHRVRDELLNTTPDGERLTDLYNSYIPNIVQVLMANPELSDQSLETMNLFVPSLQALLDGNGDTVTITPEQVMGLQSFLNALVEQGDPELQAAILYELERRPLDVMVGMTMDEAWSYTNGYQLEWLPPISNSNPYSANQGSTIPIKFSIEDQKGSFVVDNSVTLQILNSAGQVIVGPISVSNNPNDGIKIQGNKYHYNFKTKGLSDGTYTIQVFYSSANPDQPATYLIQLAKGKK